MVRLPVTLVKYPHMNCRELRETAGRKEWHGPATESRIKTEAGKQKQNVRPGRLQKKSEGTEKGDSTI